MFFTVCHTAASAGGEEPSRTPASYSSDSLSRTENLPPVHTEPSFWNRAAQLSLNVSNLCSVSSTCSVCLLQTCCMLYLYYSLCLSALSSLLSCISAYKSTVQILIPAVIKKKKGRFIHHSVIIIRYLSIQQYTALTEE